MLPPVQELLTGSSAVRAIVADRIAQILMPQDFARPFIVWSLVSNVPFNSLACVPTLDDQRVQLDCYAKDSKQAYTLAVAARDAIETDMSVIFGPVSFFEPDTKLFRWMLHAECISDH